MELKINRDHLVAGLSKVQNIVNPRTPTPILNNALIEAKEDRITLSTTNLDLNISCHIKAEVITPGAITLPVRKFLTIVKSLPKLEVEIHVAENYQTKIISGNSRFLLMGMSDKEFPSSPTLPEDQTCVLKQNDILHMLLSVSYAQSHDENRYILNGIYYTFEKDRLTLVATDGRRLGLISKEIESPNLKEAEKNAFVLPIKAINELERLLGVGEKVTLSYNKRQAAFNIEISEENQKNTGLVSNICLVSKVVQGSYPQYEQVIPDETIHRIKVDREHLLDSIIRASIVTSDRNHSIKLRLASNTLEITGHSPELGESFESIAVDFNPQEPVELIFNPQYLIDPLRVLNKDEVYFEFKDSLSPGLFKTLDTFLCVVMPLRMR